MSVEDTLVQQFSSKRILVAEDEPFIGFDIVDAVQGAGASALGPAGTVKAALDILNSNRIDGAILDVNLLDGDVAPVIDVLLARNVPFIIHTGAGLTNVLRQQYTDLTVFYKPTSPEVLVETIRGMIV
jgi:DNA-binding response OmpR family regulator